MERGVRGGVVLRYLRYLSQAISIGKEAEDGGRGKVVASRALV